MVEVPVPATIGEGAVTVDCAAETAPPVTATVVVWGIATAWIVVETGCVPAAVENRMPAASPLAVLVAVGCVRVFPAVGVAARTTVAPAIGFPLASFAVTVIVLVSVPALIDVGAAATVDCAAETPPAVTVTVAVCVIATAVVGGEGVLGPAPGEASESVATPLASVGPAGCGSVC